MLRKSAVTEDMEMNDVSTSESKENNRYSQQPDKADVRDTHTSIRGLASILSSVQSVSSSLKLPSLDKIIGFKRHADASDGDADHSWLFHLLDIIYVATIFRINAIISACGTTFDIYALSMSLFVIMFLSRYNFDVYKCTFQAKGFLHTFIFLMYFLAILVMTLNIGFEYVGNYGHRRLVVEAEQQVNYVMNNIADSHDDVLLGHAHRILEDNHELGHLCRRVDFYDQNFVSGYLASRYILLGLFTLYIYFLKRTSEITKIDHSYTIKQILGLKIIPIVTFSLIMISVYFNVNVLIIFPLIAALELVVQFLPEFLMQVDDYIKPDHHQLEERVGLFFMLILGEGVLGLLVQNYTVQSASDIYETLIASAIIIFILGFQYFNRTSKYLSHTQHPMSKPGFSACYVILVITMSFSMMVVEDAMVEFFRNIIGTVHLDEHHKIVNRQKMAVGLFFVWVILIGLRLLDTDYLHNLSLAFKTHITAEEKETFHYTSHSIIESSPINLVIALGVKALVAILHLSAFTIDVSNKSYIAIHTLLVVLPIIVELGFDFNYFLNKHNRGNTASDSIAGNEQVDMVALKALFRSSNIEQEIHVISPDTPEGRMTRKSNRDLNTKDGIDVVLNSLHA